MAETKPQIVKCEVCDNNKAVYTCPKCEVRTCCLTCVNIHKKELECDGIRDKTKFVQLKSFTDLDVLSDYRLLEEVGRSVDQLQRDPLKKCTRQHNLPVHLHRLKLAASHRKVNLQLMPQHFNRHVQNTTYLNWKTNELFWKLEWIFPQAENIKWVIERALETMPLSVLLDEILEPKNSIKTNDIEELNVRLSLSDRLQFYRAAGLSGMKVLLKAEKVKKSYSRFYELDLTLTLRENFANKTIIEFPTLYVILKHHSDLYEIIDSDEEDIKKDELYNGNIGKNRRQKTRNNKPKAKNLPVNYFFDTEFSESEDDAVTDNKRLKLGSIPDYDTLVKMEH